MARKLSLGVAACLAATLLYYSLRGIDWREVARIAAGADPARLGVAATMASATLLLRALRWRILLNAEGAVGVADAFWATAAGYFGNNFLPARAGEFVRTFMVSAAARLDAAYVLATALSERVADAIALVLIVTVILWTLPSPPGWLAAAVRPFAILAAIGACALAALPFLRHIGTSAVARVPLSASVRRKLVTAWDNVLRGVGTFHNPRRMTAFVALTGAIWTIDAIGVVIGASALGLVLPLPVSFLLIAGLGLGSALPSTPGYVGIYQFVAVSVLVPFGFARADAIAFILVAQALSYVVIGVWGGLGILRYRRARRSA